MSDPRGTEPAAEHQNLRAAAVHGLRWTAMTRPAIEIVLLGSMVVLARLISPADFGRFAVTIAFVELAGLIPSEGVRTALVQRATVTRAHLQAGFAIALLSGIVLVAITFLLTATLIPDLFGERTAYFVRLSSPAFLIAAVNAVPSAVLQRRLAFRRLSLLDVVGTLTRAGASVGLALAGMGGEAMIWGGLVAAAVTTPLLLHWAPPPLPRLRRRPARDVLDYGVPAAFAAISWVGFRNCDYAIVGARLGVLQAGFYFRAYNLGVEYQKKVSLVLGQVGFPILARTDSPEAMAAARGEMVRLLTIVLFPLLAVLAITAPVLVPWIFGAQWTPAVVPTQILALGGATTLVIDTVGIALMAAGRPKALLGYGWAHFVTYAVAVLLVSSMGLNAVAAAAAVVHGAFLIVAYLLMMRHEPRRAMRCLVDDVAPATVSSLALVAVALPVSYALSRAGTPPPVQLALVALAGAPAYVLALRLGYPPAARSLARMFGEVVPMDRVRSVIGRSPAPDPRPAA